jgi:hypothetical protein
MADENVIQVNGLKDLRIALNQLETKMGPELRKQLNGVVSIIAEAARGKVPVVSGKAAGSIKPGSTQTAAQIKVGGSAAPYFPWLDFGGSTGRGHVPGRAGSGAIKRPFLKDGRYIYPTLKERRPQIEAAVDDVIRGLAADAGFDTEKT